MNKRIKKKSDICKQRDILQVLLDTRQVYPQIVNQLVALNKLLGDDVIDVKRALYKSRYWKNIKRALHWSVVYWQHHGMLDKINELDPPDEDDWLEQFLKEE